MIDLKTLFTGERMYDLGAEFFERCLYLAARVRLIDCGQLVRVSSQELDNIHSSALCA